MDIKFLNHASLLLQLKQDLILTDPWYISPAFGGWSQYPSPNQRDIRSLISTPQQRLNVIISHGHDDHLDEFFIKKHLKNANFFIPKFKTDGLRRRIEMDCGRKAGVETT